MDLVSSVANVVKLALEIKELVETAQQNKELVVTVAKRVERLRAIVECLDNTDVSREQTIIDALNELEETFLRALELVKACQTKNKVWLFITAGDVSKKLRDVKDDIMDHMHIANFSIGVQQTVITDPAVKKRLKKEQEEKEHKKKAHLYIIIKIARDEDLKKQIGRNMYFDLVDHEKVPSFIIKKLLPFSTFKEEVAKEYGIPVQFQRFWLLAKRQNHTYRPNRPLTPHEETQSVGQLREIPNQAQNAELKLFLEVEFGLDLQPLPPPEKSKEDILLFFKLYNPEKEVLCFVGRLFVKALGKPSDIQRKLNEMAGFTPEEEIELFEEIKFEPFVMCEQIDKKLTFRSNMLEDGDIICFQKSPKAGSDTQVRYPDVPSFLEYVRNMQHNRRDH